MIYFDSEINNPISVARDIIKECKISLYTNKEPSSYRNQLMTVFEERVIKNKTLKQVANLLNLKSSERVRQIEFRLLRILKHHMRDIRKIY